MKKISIAKVWFACYDDDDGKGGEPKGGEPKGGEPKAGTPQSFSQEQVNKIVQDRLDKYKKQSSTMITELDALKAKAQLTAAERQELETRLDTMKNELLTKEELADKEKQKIMNQYRNDVAKLTEEKTNWQKRYTESSIVRAITDAAVEHNAFNPEQIVAMLRHSTSLVETLDGDGKPSGELVPKVKFSDTDKSGKPVTLDLAVNAAVKRMTEIDKYLNLFKNKSSGGMGGNNAGKQGELDLKKVAKDTEEYRRLRREGKINF